jgi:phosphoribosylformylglycinamidine synthase
VKATVLVRPKEGILDPQGQAVEQSLRKLGFAVEQARVGRVVDVEVNASSAEEARERVEEMCRQLLANPLIESYEVEVHA